MDDNFTITEVVRHNIFIVIFFPFLVEHLKTGRRKGALPPNQITLIQDVGLPVDITHRQMLSRSSPYLFLNQEALHLI